MDCLKIENLGFIKKIAELKIENFHKMHPKKTKFFFIIIFSFFLMVAIPVFAQFVENPSGSNASIQAENDAFDQAADIVTFLFALVFVSSILGFIYSGVNFIIAGGSEKTLGAAHKAWISSLIGLVLAIAGYVIINIIRYFIR